MAIEDTPLLFGAFLFGLATGGQTPALSTKYIGVYSDPRNQYLGGDYKGQVKGFTKEQATPTSPKTPVFRRVRLIRDRDGVLMGETWSDKTTGAFTFLYVNSVDPCTVLSYDHTGNFRAVVADRVVPELMP